MIGPSDQDGESHVSMPANDAGGGAQRTRFRRMSGRVRMPDDHGRRQGAIVNLALVAFRCKDAALAFLNTHDDTLGGRPLEIATTSADGFSSVSSRIAALS